MFLLIPLSLHLGYLPLSDPACQKWENPWWNFLVDILTPKESKVLARRALWLASPKLIWSRSELKVELIERRMLENTDSPILLGQPMLLHTSLGLLPNNQVHSSTLPNAMKDGDKGAFDISGPRTRVHQPLSEVDKTESNGAKKDASV